MKKILSAAVLCLTLFISIGAAKSMPQTFCLHPIGKVVKTANQTSLEIFPAYRDGLLGLAGFSHLVVLYWFDRNDTPAKRATLRVHPRGDKRNPLTGVFATRSPRRPNLIGLSVCKIRSVEAGRILVDKIDAFNQTPIIDIKPYIPANDEVSESSVPGWVRGEFEK
ncbi:MAG: tRNA (N6-threonylcarbamoyladenosine(37)-N6)-methyltransferase TrmO [Deltaproteobacteria bacterium]